MEYVIRNEDWRDYPRIAELHAEAFDYDPGMGEAGLVDALRRRTLHAPELSLVAKSEGRRFQSVVLEREDGALIGFVKYREDRPHAPDMLMAKDGDAIGAVLGHLSSLSPQPLSLPLHPHSRAVKQLMRMPLEPEMKAWDAGMLRAFGTRNPEPEVEAYINEVSDGRRLPGLVIWPSAFDVCS